MKALEKHVLSFIEKEKLFPLPHIPLILCVSGGLDSMVLLHLMQKLFPKRRIIIMHINHHTRPQENQAEENLVRCQLPFAECRVFHWEAPSSSNFEMEARKFRYKCLERLKKDLGEEVYVCTAHHIDDSFEWSLLQMLKTSSLRPSLGIPLKRGSLRRPLLCLTKSQIKAYAQKEKIQYFYDSSNDSSDPERNFLRNEIIPKLKQRFPSYLKHYAFRSQALNKLIFPKAQSSFEETILDSGTILLTYSKNNFPQELDLLPYVLNLSKAERGKVRDQLRRTLLAIENFSKNKTMRRGPYLGPMSFSGGVYLYATDRKVLIMHQDQASLFSKDALRSLLKKSKE